MSGSEPKTPPEVANVPWSDVVRFVRQLSHDLRNQLNAAELQAVYLSELTEDAELKSEIKRLREMLSELGTILQKLSAALSQVKPTFMEYRAADLMEDISKKVTTDFSKEGEAVNWAIEVGDAMLEVDPQLLQQAILELFENAFHHGPKGDPLSVTVGLKDNRLVFSLHEPKTGFDRPMEGWGREPLRNVGQGHYGLGLNRVRVIIEVHGGELRGEYDAKASTLITTITLPLAARRS